MSGERADDAELVDAEVVDEDSDPSKREVGPRTALEPMSEPPVVARLVVEIRSDGSRTIARGSMEDVLHGERVAVEAHGTSPLGLAFALARSIFAAPAMARTAVRALLPGKAPGKSPGRSPGRSKKDRG